MILNGKPFSLLSRDFRRIMTSNTGEAAVHPASIDDADRPKGAVQETEDKYRKLLENTKELIVVIQDGMIRYMNHHGEHMGGFLKEDVMSRPFLEFVHPDDRVGAVERYVRRISGEQVPSQSMIRIRNSSGEYRWAEVKSILIEWDGDPATLNFIADATDRIKQEETLREAEDKYRLVVENAQEAIVILQDGRVKFLNERTTHIMGYSRSEFLKKPFIEFIHRDNRNLAYSNYVARLEGKEAPVEVLYKFLAKDGSIVWGLVKSIKIDWEGSPATLNFISDVTDRMIAKDLVDQERSKSEFYLDLLGHDIGNLMQGISAWIEIARAQDGLDDKMQLYLDQSWLLSERSKRLVKNVLIISRIRDREPELEEIHLVGVLKRSIGEIINNFPKKNVSLELLDNGLDPVVMAEPIVEEMFYNLIHNAVKFQKGAHASVKVVLERSKKDGIAVSILDRGPGITDEQKRGIFKRFKDLTGRKYTGIGLALTKELVDRYGGSIAVRDNMEGGEVVGACFLVTLPCSSI